MTKIEELVRLLDDLKGHSKGRAFLPPSAFNNAAPFIVNAALEALPELQEIVKAERIARRKDEYLQSWEEEE